MSGLIRTYILLLALSPVLAYLWHNLSYIAYYNIMAFIAQIIFIVFFINRKLNGAKIKVPKYIYPFFLLIIYYYIWGFYNGEVQERGLFMHTLNNKPLQIALLLLLIENTYFNKKFIKSLIPVIKITIILALIFSIQTKDFDFFTARTIGSKGFFSIRRSSIFGFLDPIELGISFCSLLAVLISWNFLNKKDINKTILYTIIGAVVIFLTNSRWMMVNYIVLLFIYVIYSKSTFRGVFKYIAIGFIAIFITWNILPFFGYNLDVFIQQRLLSESAMSRITAFDAFARYFPENPWWGRGIHLTRGMEGVELEGSHQIHVGYLAHLDEWGTIGSIFLFLFWFLLIKKFYREAKKTKFYGGFFAFSFFLIANLTLVHYNILFYGLILAFVFHKHFKDLFILKRKYEKTRFFNYRSRKKRHYLAV